MAGPTVNVLDLFACEGIGGSGYTEAGFGVWAVDMDKNRLKYNPAPSHHGDALKALETLLSGRWLWFDNAVPLMLQDFDAIHASPPCQAYSRGNAGKETDWPKLIPEVREALKATGKPYVIENVLDAGPEMKNPTLLCGCMFNLGALDEDWAVLHLQRPRLFETNWQLGTPAVCEGEGRPRREHPSQEHVAGVYGGSRRAKRLPGETLPEVAPRDRHAAKHVRKGGYVPRSKGVAERLLGVTHGTTWQGLKECIPPAYTKWIGGQLRNVVDTHTDLPDTGIN